MRWMLVWILAAGQMAAQAPVRLMRGEVVQFAYAEGTGEIAVRDALYRVHKCGLSASTWVEMNNKRLTLGHVRLTMSAEVLADTRAGEGQCTALTIYLREAMPRWPMVRPLSTGSSILDNLWPRGNLVFTGTVRAMGEGELVVRTRKGEEQRMRVREDTVFSTGGRVVKPVELELQQRVQVRAGRGFDGRLEVYQVTWGEILQPDSDRQSGGSGPNP